MLINKILAAIGFFLLLVSIVLASLLKEQGKKIAMMEAANDTLIKELLNVNRRIALLKKARIESQKNRITVENEIERNHDWAGDYVPDGIINSLCEHADCEHVPAVPASENSAEY